VKLGQKKEVTPTKHTPAIKASHFKKNLEKKIITKQITENLHFLQNDDKDDVEDEECKAFMYLTLFI